jgi:sorbitol/mannitol transport system permease protein
MDGANFLSRFWHLTLPHLARAITVVILIQTIFLLSSMRKSSSPPMAAPATPRPTCLPDLPHGASSYDVGGASAGGVIAVVLANIVAFFLMRAVGKNLDR